MDKQPNSRSCFLCGRQNPIGLKMTWHNDREAGQVRAEIVVPEHFNGYPGVVHGGIVAAILDETSGRAVLLDGTDDDLMVTMRKSHARVAGEIRLADGTVTAQCEALLARAPAEVRQTWGAEKPYWHVYEE